MKDKIRYILFDLGGVLVELTEISKVVEWMNFSLDQDEFRKMWLYSSAVRDYEMGKNSTLEFAEAIISEFKFSISPEEFIKEFIYFPKGLYSGTEELLQQLSQKYLLACLSNTNELHWDRMCDENSIDKLIPFSFPSHKTGFMKPDEEAYLHVIKSLNCEADKILFFDDNQINVDAAKQLGMNAIRVVGLEDLKLKLRELEII